MSPGGDPAGQRLCRGFPDCPLAMLWCRFAVQMGCPQEEWDLALGMCDVM